LVLIVGELALMAPTHHIGGSTNNSAPATKNPGQVSTTESLLRGPNGVEEMASGRDMPTADQGTAEAAPNRSESQSSVAAIVQQTLSHAAAPITVGPLGR
jgi:hypothetical protein